MRKSKRSGNATAYEGALHAARALEGLDGAMRELGGETSQFEDNCINEGAMENRQLRQRFEEFVSSKDFDIERGVWADHQKKFREFWRSRILPLRSADQLSETADYDPIIKMIDVKARGYRRETDVAVAHVGLHQGMWYRIFNELVEKKELKGVLDKIFRTDDPKELIKLLNQLERANEGNRNGLTGKSANAINALLVVNSPERFVSCVSLKHRFRILQAFNFAEPITYSTYGDKIVQSNEDMLNGFREQYGLHGTPREISKFLYLAGIKQIWQAQDVEINVDDIESPPEDPTSQEMFDSQFVIEKHLEDYLIANWERTSLGAKYELIDENGEFVSQQFSTDISKIDLLVRDRKDKSYVVIELKKGQSSDSTAGQLMRYMEWVREKKAKGKKVKGIVIASEIDERLRYAMKGIRDAEVMLYRLKFSLEPFEC